jgi:hypothetical protein
MHPHTSGKPKSHPVRPAIFNRPHLASEIAVTLLIKFLFIFAIWYAFFSDPVDEKITKEELGSALFGSRKPPLQAPQPVLKLEEN